MTCSRDIEWSTSGSLHLDMQQGLARLHLGTEQPITHTMPDNSHRLLPWRLLPRALSRESEAGAVVAAPPRLPPHRRHPLYDTSRHWRREYRRPRRVTLPTVCQPCAAALKKGLCSELRVLRRAPNAACPLACPCPPYLRPRRAPYPRRMYNAQLRLPPRPRRGGPAGRCAQWLCCRVDAAAARRDRAGLDCQTNCAAQACRPGAAACGRHRCACPAAWRKPRRPSPYA